MWRAFFWALGLFSIILGAECMLIDKAVLAKTETVKSAIPGVLPKKVRNKEFVPPDWAPWSLLSLGAVTIIYSFTIPKRLEG